MAHTNTKRVKTPKSLEWPEAISVRERLPRQGQQVLALFLDRGSRYWVKASIAFEKWEILERGLTGNFCKIDDRNISHWIPLPPYPERLPKNG